VRPFSHISVDRITPRYILKRYTGDHCMKTSFDRHDKMFIGPDGDTTTQRTRSILSNLFKLLSHPVFKVKTRCSSYVCPESSCHTYSQNVSIEYQCLYYIVSYYKNLLQVQKGLNNGMDSIFPQAVDRGFRTTRRNLHPHTPHLLSSRT
jgi:hypothetical protein